MLCWTVHLKGGPKKTLHAAVAVGNKLYSFGGYCYGETLSCRMAQIDVHVFNAMSLRWTKLPPATTGRGEHPLEVPFMRVIHTAVLIEDAVYVWGGIVNIETEESANRVITIIRGKDCKVLYGFNVNTHRWFNPTISGTVPDARFGHSACVLGRAMYVFGGFNMQKGATNDVYKLDTTTMVWSLINVRGTPTPVSGCHSAIIIGTKMFVYGGRGDQDEIIYNDVRVFDTETNSWLNMPSAESLPEGRSGHSVFAYNGELYIFGGDNFPLDRTFNDLWKFSPETLSWRKVEPKGKGPCSANCRMCCCMVGDRIILFGGYTPDDLYVLDLSPCLKTLCKLAVIEYGLERSGLPHDIRWELASMTRPPTQRHNNREQVPGSGTEESNRRRDGSP